MSELLELKEQVKKINAILLEKFPEQQTQEERIEERNQAQKAEHQARIDQLEEWKEEVSKGTLTVEQVFNLKRNARYNGMSTEEFFISPPGLKRAGSSFYKEARKHYIENLINQPGGGFYRLKNSLWKEPCKLLGYMSNPANPKDKEAAANEAYAKQEFASVYAKFLESITPAAGAVIFDYCNLLEGVDNVAGVPVQPFVFTG